MFGQLSAFVNGNMFMGIFGEDVLVRLPEEDREKVLGAGGRVFEPMPGRPMREYVVLPEAWRDDPKRVARVGSTSLDHADELPPEEAEEEEEEVEASACLPWGNEGSGGDPMKVRHRRPDGGP